MNKTIVILAGHWDTTPIVYNALKTKYKIERIIFEDPVSRIKFLKNRVKKLGIVAVTGQVIFQLLIGKLLAITSKERIREITELYGLSKASIPAEAVIEVPSVNAEESLEHLIKLKPDLVIVHGTRIISKKVLQKMQCPFVNIHAGITPRYRGSHGAYWAIANEDMENCGVTVHLVDTGIDTGNILYQKRIEISKKDNFTTYPYLQLAEGLTFLVNALDQIMEKNIQRISNSLNSALWHHPTFWFYLYKRWTKGVK